MENFGGFKTWDQGEPGPPGPPGFTSEIFGQKYKKNGCK